VNKEEVYTWAKRLAESKTVIAFLGALAGFAMAFLVLGRSTEKQVGGTGCFRILASMGTLAIVIWAVGILGVSWPVVALIGAVAAVTLAVIGGRDG